MNKLNDIIRQIVVVFSIVITLVVNGLANALPINGQNTGQISDRFHVYFVPAGYVFSIWALIYLGLIAFAIFQALPSQRNNPRLRATGWFISVGGLANSAWIYFWHYEQFPLTLIAMLVLLLTLIITYKGLGIGRVSVPVIEKWSVQLPFSIYLGWITVATVANVTDLLDYFKWDGFGLPPVVWMMIVLFVVFIITTLMIFTYRDIAFTLVILWALAGISFKHAGIPSVFIPTWITFGLVAIGLVIAYILPIIDDMLPSLFREKILPIISVIFLLITMLILFGPFLVPVPPLAGLHSPQFLADGDSQFIEINGLTVHYKKFGQGEPVFILLHGFGASLYSWNAVMQPLSMSGTVIAFDRPAFGLTERQLIWDGANPYTPQAQVELVTGLLDYFDIKQAILVGNSAGGTISIQFALDHSERIKALILVDPAVYNGGGAPAWLRPLFTSAQMHHLGPLVARQLKSRGDEFLNLAWHDPSRIPTLTRDLYKKSFLVENWDKALWELTIASQPANLKDQLDKLVLPVLVITGEDDRIVPTRESLRLAEELPNASLVVIQQAGHLPHEEQPVIFVDAVNTFVNSLLH